MPHPEGDRLHIPHPTWARDNPDTPDLDAENWREVERWAGRLFNVPLPIHWPGAVANHVNVRNGCGEFGAPGTIWKIRYRWDPTLLNSTDATVQWYFDTTLVDTHTLPAGDSPHIERPMWKYMEEGITAIVTDDGGGSGLTAFVYFR